MTTTVIAGVLVAAIGLSRVYPSDVIAGYLAAAIWVSSWSWTAGASTGEGCAGRDDALMSRGPLPP